MIGSIEDMMGDKARIARERHVVDPAVQHTEDVKADQSYGILLGDGKTLASIENRWVRKRLFREGKLMRKDRRKAA
jgi:hypothetical protein